MKESRKVVDTSRHYLDRGLRSHHAGFQPARCQPGFRLVDDESLCRVGPLSTGIYKEWRNNGNEAFMERASRCAPACIAAIGSYGHRWAPLPQQVTTGTARVEHVLPAKLRAPNVWGADGRLCESGLPRSSRNLSRACSRDPEAPASQTPPG